MMDIRLVPAGDSALVAELDELIDPAVNARVIALGAAVRDADLPGIRDIVPAFRSVTVYFDPLVMDVERLAGRLRQLAVGLSSIGAAPARTVEIPVCYDAGLGPDLADVAAFGHIDQSEVAAIHAATTYRVYMLGFVPGFAYLGTVDPRIAAPRRREPRVQVPAGAVAIAGGQTGIYPRQTPGGWNIVGRTPITVAALDRTPPSLLQPGDAVRFVPIDRPEFDRIAGAQEQRG
jgi:inhibitor of KinA